MALSNRVEISVSTYSPGQYSRTEVWSGTREVTVNPPGKVTIGDSEVGITFDPDDLFSALAQLREESRDGASRARSIDSRSMRTCSIAGCDRIHWGRGWCRRHYTQWKRHGDPLADGRRRRGLCTIDGCDAPHEARGWCQKHLTRWKRHGDPLKAALTRFLPLEDRFWAHVNKNGPIPAHRPELGPCWVWTASTNHGYGCFRVDGKTVSAHRFAYERLVGSVPASLLLDHVCHNGTDCTEDAGCPHRRCVNPAHLEPVTERENLVRGNGIGGKNARKTHCANGHLLAGANIEIVNGNTRECLICRRDRYDKRNERRRAKCKQLAIACS